MGNDSQKEPEVPDERHYPASGAGLAGHPKNRNFAGPDPESAGPLVVRWARGSSPLTLHLPFPLGRANSLSPLALPSCFLLEVCRGSSLLALLPFGRLLMLAVPSPFPLGKPRGSSLLAFPLPFPWGRSRGLLLLALPLHISLGRVRNCLYSPFLLANLDYFGRCGLFLALP